MNDSVDTSKCTHKDIWGQWAKQQQLVCVFYFVGDNPCFGPSKHDQRRTTREEERVKAGETGGSAPHYTTLHYTMTQVIEVYSSVYKCLVCLITDLTQRERRGKIITNNKSLSAWVCWRQKKNTRAKAEHVVNNNNNNNKQSNPMLR